MKLLSIKKITAIGIGTALFIVLSYLIIPTGVPNTSIQPRIAILSFFSIVFGPIVGFSIGILGHALADAFQWGSIWWSWVIADGALGLLIGLFYKQLDVENKLFDIKNIIYFNGIQIIANSVCWIFLAPTLDILMYKEPLDKVYFQGIISFIVNSFTVLVIGTIIIKYYSKSKAGNNNLTKED
ncbi:ECF-type riboflavin transporter substrate-binding protein [Caviibacter abscessus]|uniref:ECF-type riboflavin transporter substrate-binding protein n=1 Tax=Caviibacter abscessus TaxID=1766719 RepID=UPI0008393D5B|nr:ECF-type riboflavin transporter substrate-binding protein [Caviibacter abscessus]